MSYLLLESYALNLASPEHCMVWSGEAKALFGGGANPWKTVVQGAQLALQNFHHRSSADATLYVAVHAFTSAAGRSGSLISFYFATDARTERSAIEAFGGPLVAANAGWTHDGVHPAPEHAFPCLALRHGEIHQVWQEDGTEEPFTCLVSGRGLHAKVHSYPFGHVEHRWLPVGVKHAVGRWSTPDRDKQHLREQLKLAFAYRIAERVVNADGVVDDNEVAFMKRSFPDDQLEQYWLDDPQLRAAMARQAEAELAGLLGYHEKLGLLSTFYGACYADGSIAVQELMVLKEACRVLGLENQEVVKYLQRFW